MLKPPLILIRFIQVMGILIILISGAAAALAGYTFFIVLPPSLDGIDNTAYYLTTFKIPEVYSDMHDGAQKIRNAGNAIVSGSNDINDAGKQLDNGVQQIRGLANDLSNLGDTAADIRQTINEPIACLLGICINFPDFIQSPVRSATGILINVGDAAGGIVSTASGLSRESSSLASNTREVGDNIRGLANDIDDLTSKLESGAANIESQIQEAGQSIYGIKLVFYYGVLAILGAGLGAALSGGALVAVGRVFLLSNEVTKGESSDT